MMTPEFLASLLELPRGAGILKARMMRRDGLPQVGVLVAHSSIPKMAHRVNAEYSNKSKFDRFNQTDPIVTDWECTCTSVRRCDNCRVHRPS